MEDYRMKDYRMKTLTVVLTKETREVRLIQTLNTYDAKLDVRPIDPDYTPEVYDLYEFMIARNPSNMHTVKLKGFVGYSGLGDLQIILHVDEFSKLYTIHIEVRAQHIISLLEDLEDFGIDLVSIY